MADHSTSAVTEDQVKAWLIEYPEFLLANPDVLETLEIPHGSGTASLIEHQVRRLRQENGRLKQQLSQLSGIAGENERLMQRLHRLTLELMASVDVEEFLGQLVDRLADDFNADQVKLALIEPNPELLELPEVQALPDEHPAWLKRLLERGEPDCGRLTRAKIELLFSKPAAEQIGSAALVPVSGQGVLAIGAQSPERFYPDMGTLFLELLGRTIQFRLETLDDRQRKRA